MKRIAPILFALFALVSCSTSSEKKVSRLFAAAPSDAVVLSYSDKLSELSVPEEFAALDLSEYMGTEVLFSWNYAGKMTPLLCLPRADNGLCAQAEAKGLTAKALKVPGGEVTVISPSRSLVAESERHVQDGQSIFDADCFDTAFQQAKSPTRIVKGMFFPEELGMLDPYIGKRERRNFFKNMAQWVVFNKVDTFNVEVSYVCPQDDSYFPNIQSGLRGSSSRLWQMVPDTVGFVVGTVFPDVQKYIDSFERYRKSRNKESMDKKVRNWAVKSKLKEVAVMRWIEGGEVLLLRAGKLDKGTTADQADYVGRLFGKIYEISDVSCRAELEGWIIIGSQDDVSRYLSSTRTPKEWAFNGVRYVVLCDGWRMLWTDDGIKITSTKPIQ